MRSGAALSLLLLLVLATACGRYGPPRRSPPREDSAPALLSPRPQPEAEAEPEAEPGADKDEPCENCDEQAEPGATP